MLANDFLSNVDDESLSFDDSYGSSISDSFTSWELNKSENQVNEQWEAIEKTLYEEEGEHVTNPTLLKECKLWRETFPHLRVRGTKIDLKQSNEEKEEEKEEEDDGNDDKSVQTLENHLKLNKIEKKREIIKTKVVDELVERLIAKFNLKKQNDFEIDQKTSKWDFKNGGVQITEITTSDLPPSLSPSSTTSNNNNKLLEDDICRKKVNDVKNVGNNNVNNNHDGDHGDDDDDDDDNKLLLDVDDKKNVEIINENEIVLPNGDRESYYERGKSFITSGIEEKNSDDIEQRLCEIFDTWEMDDVHDDAAAAAAASNFAAKDESDDENHDSLLKKSFDKNNEKSPENVLDFKKLISNSHRDLDLSEFQLKVPTGDKIGMKPEKKFIPSRSKYNDIRSSDVIKPFEMTQKIDKRYEGLLNTILEKRNIVTSMEPKKKNFRNRQQRNTARECSEKDLNVSYREYLEKIRISSGFDELYREKRRSNLPKINKKNNYWLERGEIHARDTAENDLIRLKKFREVKTEATTYNFDDVYDHGDYYRDPYESEDYKFLRDLKREMGSVYKRPPMNKIGGGLEKINLNRPKPLSSLLSSTSTSSFSHGEFIKNRDLKSSSCGDSPNRNVKNVQKRKNKTQFKSGRETWNDTSTERDTFGKTRFRNGANFNGIRSKSQNVPRCHAQKEPGILPPIESSIICRELTGYSKIGTKTKSNKKR